MRTLLNPITCIATSALIVGLLPASVAAQKPVPVDSGTHIIIKGPDGKNIGPGGIDMQTLLGLFKRVDDDTSDTGSVKVSPAHDTPGNSTQTRPAIGKRAPAFMVKRWLNRTDTLSPKFGDGHVYLVNFTAMWCEPCKLVYPVLDTLQTRFAAQGLRVIYATVLTGMGEAFMVPIPRTEELAKLPKYFAQHHVTAPVAIFDTVAGPWTPYADEDDGTMGIPKLVVIDGRGIVRDVITGWDSPETRALAPDSSRVNKPFTRDRLIADFERLLH
jgi:thiol-disulfide isomerase/thioredoxin